MARRPGPLLAAALFAAALSGCAWLDTRQRALALRPTPAQPSDVAALRDGDQRFVVPAAGENGGIELLALWWLPNHDPGAPTLLYLHGTFRNLYRNLPKIDAWRDAGFAVLAVDYRGWGDSTPIVPSEATITADARLAWDELVRRQPDPRRRVIFGHSLGSAVAVDLASRLRHRDDYVALVLESAFTSLPDLAATAGVWGRIGAALTTLEFDSLAKIGRVDAPLLMMHGDADRTVPIDLGRRLRDSAPNGARWIEVPGGSHSRLHSEAPWLYPQAYRHFFAPAQEGASPTTPAPR